MNNQLIQDTKTIARELRLSRGSLTPGLRTRANIVRVALLKWLKEEATPESIGFRKVLGPEHVFIDVGNELFRPVRTERYEAIERLIQLVAGACSSLQKPRELLRGSGLPWDAVACSDAILEQCAAFESDQTEKPKRKTQPDKPITKWMKTNLHKYKDAKDAIRNYIEIKGHDGKVKGQGDLKKLYQDYDNDKRRPKPTKSS